MPSMNPEHAREVPGKMPHKRPEAEEIAEMKAYAAAQKKDMRKLREQIAKEKMKKEADQAFETKLKAMTPEERKADMDTLRAQIAAERGEVEEFSDEDLEAMKAPEVVTAEHELQVSKKGFKAAMKAGEADVAQQKLAAKGEAMSARAELAEEAATAEAEKKFFAKGEAMDEKARRAQEAPKKGFFARFADVIRRPKMTTGAETMKQIQYTPTGERIQTMEPEGLKTPPRVAYPERPTAEEEEEERVA